MRSRNFLLALLLATAPLALFGDDTHQHYDPSTKLGTVSFPVPSCSASVQKPFERGAALLHSFWYEEADKQFQAVATQDPHCAMAYWGQAMSLYHELWARPTAATIKQGSELVKKAQSIGTKTPRERGYIAAMATFYQGGTGKWDFEQHATAYSKAMGKVYHSNPSDHEAAAFYALSLLGSAPDNDASLVNRKQAISILNNLFERYPDHPGIAHYLIHACDNPQFAQEGLKAARTYAQIAPASPHALHMPSHIFARLGLWQEDINSNLASVAAVKHNDTGMRMGAENQVHAMDFLEYAYLQIGEDSKAKAMVEDLGDIKPEDLVSAPKDYLNRSRAHFPAIYALETRDWKGATALEPPVGAEPYVQAITYWAQAVGAGHLRDAAADRKAVDELNAMLDATRQGPKPYIADGMSTNRDEATSWMEFAAGNNDEALGLLRSVADKQDALGKGEVELPAREMLADMLLEMGRSQEALTEYERSMKVDPNRFNALAGAAHAAELANQPQKASTYYAQLLKNCSTSDSDRPELTRARSLLAQK
jgi:tetratricopeptide (TPR) repeat protein